MTITEWFARAVAAGLAPTEEDFKRIYGEQNESILEMYYR